VNDLELTYSEAQSHIFFDSEELGRFRFFPKGRRLGATRGGAHAFIEWMLDGDPCLWGDTINPNIDRYVERYFQPVLNAHEIPYNWNAQKRLLKVGNGYTDFRSADRPENWEGFGYRRVFLNEAGIILDDEYLYTNTVLPMLLDFPDSQLIAAGTPKLMQGTGRLFSDLCEKAKRGEPGYYTKTFTTYDNPWLSEIDIKRLAKEIPAADRKQEIYGQFLEAGGQRVKREWIRYGRCAVDCDTYMGVDLAISQKTSADWTTIVVIQKSIDGKIYVRAAIRARLTFYQTQELIKAWAARWKPRATGIEATQYQAAAVQEILRTTALNAIAITPDKDKVTRFQPIETRYEQGLIYHDTDTNDLPKSFEDEILAFPQGDHDDFVDGFGNAYKVANQGGGKISVAQRPNQ
jgi:predicted phage terminase large subunit-like protein